MKTAIQIIIALVALCYVGGLQITLNPFSIKLNDWRPMVAWFFISIAITLFQSQGRLQGYKKGCKDGASGMVEEIKKEFHLIPKDDENTTP
ncbi:hypothetical protein KDU71_07575 [Carboxylicivirga sediminis]|uniref:Uncharacterized protein n=1 Tax=Carboxylicivirga sediminis TaxID=2006564 RepID=A0A941F279_9BACT|nr:hypothetical protein [Carboxylicivirga sediminis]MBR8535416.1 hypothetical protein [Carboxylicivirga sediminis]